MTKNLRKRDVKRGKSHRKKDQEILADKNSLDLLIHTELGHISNTVLENQWI